MPEYQTILTAYNPRTISRDDGSSFVLHKFTDIQGTEMVARADVANIARGLLNFPSMVTTRSEQKGQWLNVYLDHIAPVSANGTQSVQQPVYTQQPTPPQPSPPPTPPPPVPQQTGLSEKDRQIHRQVAAKVAAKLSTTPSEYWQNCLDLARYFDTGLVPQQPGTFRPDTTDPGPQEGQYASYGDSPPF